MILSQQVKNVSKNTPLAEAITVSPEETVEFSVSITSAGVNPLKNITLKTNLPSQLNYKGNLSIDGVSSAGDITSGIPFGDLPLGQTKIINFQAQAVSASALASSSNKVYVNTTVSYNGQTSADSVEIDILKGGAVAKEEEGTDLSVFRAGMIFSYFGNWKFWLAVLSIILAILIIWAIYRLLFRRGFILRRETVTTSPFRIITP